jgi:hypothetical protein
MITTSRAAFAALVFALFGACAPAIAQNDQTVDPAIAERLAAATAPQQPYHVVFSWTLRERDGRFTGQGSARVDVQRRARLDLFGPRGETYMAAALVDTDLRLAASPDAAGELPPPEMLWTVLGIFVPPADATLLAASDDGSAARLEYGRGNERWRFQFTNGRLTNAEWQAGRQSRRTVELRGQERLGLPREAYYRDWAEFRELILTLEQVHDADAFPPDIFVVGR